MLDAGFLLVPWKHQADNAELFAAPAKWAAVHDQAVA
jgi:hypothetical protein